MDSTLTRVQDTWSGRADQWHAFIGEDGDDNRQNSSDKYIWEYAGDLKGLKVLDAGCGTGYLSMKLATAGLLTYVPQ
jgi:2-polyprenyl-3-methyl-5-hydroxy-6-metoxy-1,4-benzoquinol methylase